MPDYSRIYNEALAEARAEFRGRLSRQLLARLYAEFARLLVAIDNAAGEGQLTAERAEALKRSIQRHLARYARQLELSLGDGARQATTLAVSGHRQALQAVASEAGVQISFSFDAVPERALRNMIARRGLDITDRGGLSGTFETLVRRRVGHLSGPIDELLTDAVAQGRSAGRAARDLAVMMARDEPALQAALERVQGGRSILRDLHAGRLDRITTDPELRRLLYDARRLVVTEINVAFFESDREGAAASPVVDLLEWTLSGRHGGLHSSPDACDLAAEADLGWGPGRYPPEQCPSLLHPHCACSTQKVLLRPSQWGNPPQREVKPPNIPGEEEIKQMFERQENEFSRSVTSTHVRAQRCMFEQKARWAYEVAKGPEVLA